jgi:hypothetical protein
MSAKQSGDYEYTIDTTVLADGTAISKHAECRFRERTPQDSRIRIEEAYSESEEVPHPSVVRLQPDKYPDTIRGRVYNHSCEWWVVFIINESKNPTHPRDADEVIVTVVNPAMYGHGPTRAYLHAFGPHNSQEDGHDW